MMRNAVTIPLAVALAVVLALLTAFQWQGCSRQPDVLRIAAAADLKFALDEIDSSFRRAYPDTRIEISYGSSGTFYAQLANHAPFDLFLSADLRYPEKLDSQGLVLPGSRFTYGIGRIVLWAPNGSKADLARDGMRALLDPSVGKIAIANPDHAPYGRAAVAALRSFGLYDSVKSRLVYGANISETATFVQTGAADLGIIALSLALAPSLQRKGEYYEIPRDSYPTISQGGAILKWAASSDAARAFRDYMLSGEGKAILQRNGFSLPANH